MMYISLSVKRRFNASAESIDSCVPAQLDQADLSRTFHVCLWSSFCMSYGFIGSIKKIQKQLDDFVGIMYHRAQNKDN